MSLNKRMAEALVECGHAYSWQSNEVAIFITLPVTGELQKVDPFYAGDDPIRRCHAYEQAFALEDYFEKRPELWDLWNRFPRPYVYDEGESMREWRLDRIKWCFKQLEET